MKTINHELAEIALDRVTGLDFEKFANAFLPAILGIEFVPTGGIHDGGADAFQGTGILESTKVGIFFQASTQQDHKAKIRHTVSRLRKFGRVPKSLTYITSQPIITADVDEDALSSELDVFIRIRPRSWIVNNINQSSITVAAYTSFLESHVAFIHETGGATFIENPKHLQSRAVCVFLGQEAERRRSNSPLIESVADSLILWSLNETDPNNNIFLTRVEMISKIEGTLPTAKHFIRGVIDHRIKVLSSKGNVTGREVRHYRAEDKFCLPYETRRVIEQENTEDEYFKIEILKEFELAAKNLAGDDADPKLSFSEIARIAILSIERTFESTGLELAAFLSEEESYSECPPISDHIDLVIQEKGVSGSLALQYKDFAMSVVREAFYESTELQRVYFSKISRTFALLFSLRADPRIVEYFQSMAGKFELMVGTDILIRALSEQYLKKEDQMTCNLLNILIDSGSKLFLCEPVLEEVHSHLEITDWEFKNYFSAQEPHINLDIARHASKILIRSYFYAKLRPVKGMTGPSGWKSHIGQFCDYKKLHSQSGEGKQQLGQYLSDRFDMEFLSNEDLQSFASEQRVSELAKHIKPIKKDDILAVNDARMILSVYGKRKDRNQNHHANPYGFSAWWLTHETRIQSATSKIIKEQGAKYIIRPDFILNFISLSPTMEEVRQTHRKVMPTLLGIKLSNRMREDIFHDAMQKISEALAIDESRAKVLMGDLSNKLKGDSFKQYEINCNPMHELEE